MDLRAAARGRLRLLEHSYGERLRPPASVADSRLISCVMHMRSSSHTRAYHFLWIQRHLGHSNLGVTSIYVQGIDNAEIIDTVHARRAPMIAVSTWLRL